MNFKQRPTRVRLQISIEIPRLLRIEKNKLSHLKTNDICKLLNIMIPVGLYVLFLISPASLM